MIFLSKMPIIGVVVVAGTVLTGCVTPEQQYEIDRGNAYQRCSSFGHRPGTRDFNFCLENQDSLNRGLLQNRQDERGRAIRHANQNWNEQQRHDNAMALARQRRSDEISRDYDRRMNEINRNHERRMSEIRQRGY